ncbi:glutamyl-tRNA amidotransferase [Candidatus Shapirobacteria bacterium CG10_big_fil_rev_8_21_14_0_10_38_14]|uniref:Glutamyl-tRNA amidotransferase n=1 Tax=Candidatus Shapirobacteria bacterium CG10_big_fil_rev_8_21_14_0_10_38_14 TaxID=1974483 RepID=A0A2M8L5T2_9BACT|nr:MAG: glutamyl-tRNA amidotransferase [Candidatus Shapirobacteria bacterium CG10_big_fil_rev_8_21_14_0_10_38_14]
MAILTQIENDLKTALKARDGTTVATVRVLLAEIRNQQIALHGSKDETLKDEHIVALVRQEIKKRREAIQLYQQGKRPELAEKEKKEMEILSKYLPQQISAEELEKVVKQAIKEAGAKDSRDFGKVMGVVMAKVKGKADGSQVAEIVKKSLEIFL